MISLITGVPGAGKTCFVMGDILSASKEGRPIFVHGIPELTIPHTTIFCSAVGCSVCEQYGDRGDDPLMAEFWQDWAPDGAVIIMDEVQHIYRPRRQGVDVPQSVIAFETHRHKGLDFILLSQSPMLFDTNIRRLIGKHIHLKANWAGRKKYEWAECKDDPKRINDAVASNHKLEKKNFELYKSAEMHTKVKRKIPMAVFAVVAAFMFVGYMAFQIFGRVSQTVSAEVITDAAQGGLGPPVAATDNFNQDSFIPGSILNKFNQIPTIELVPESAPAFIDLVEVVTFPRLASCVLTESKGTCNCYTQQATPLQVTYVQCHDYINNRRFNPYLQKPKNKSNRDALTEGNGVTPEAVDGL